MKNEVDPETTMPAPPDNDQATREDTRAPDREQPTARRADPLALDPYSPNEPTRDYLAGLRPL
jgi:hypothetical protein